MMTTQLCNYKPIPGYEERYCIDTEGNVYSLFSGKILRQFSNGRVLCVSLSMNGVCKCMPIHILMRKTFMDNDDPNLMVLHIDGNKHNNNLDNLKLVTHEEYYEVFPTNRRTKAQKIGIYLDGGLVRTFKSQTEAAANLNVSQGQISRALKLGGKVRGYEVRRMED